ncbi:uncharacterized protein LOC128351541 isoform X3 [Hemicordylus capensis]|uniref:uncharacterized protein LOC128351541 isoform X3 n=1 Tax=Hemicordylus capensis TaxID=884348 RepID=UPI0023024A3C|nr:uncharacterized protein LOC128351541 isoform X3 [Hemicordylus capensis]XP_053167159.1 uncharacterized protein LOC128351541 isoform X3 [Hemicordylus capensis]
MRLFSRPSFPAGCIALLFVPLPDPWVPTVLPASEKRSLSVTTELQGFTAFLWEGARVSRTFILQMQLKASRTPTGNSWALSASCQGSRAHHDGRGFSSVLWPTSSSEKEAPKQDHERFGGQVVFPLINLV